MNSVEIGLGNEALHLYLSEVKDSNQEYEEEDHVVLNEVEQATDFLQKVGLTNLSNMYQQGKEITDCVVNDSLRQRNLTEKQAQTVKYRVKTLNNTLRSRQPRRKQRQDIRDVAWNAETSSTGTRSRSATPDSLDSVVSINEDLTSDEDQQLSLPHFPFDSSNVVFKGKLKLTTSEPLPAKVFSRADRGDVAHLGSENVILKGYQPLNEYSTLTRRERSGSDPTTEVHLESVQKQDSEVYRHKSSNLHNQLSRSHSNLSFSNANDAKLFAMCDEAVSFEGLLRKNEQITLHSKILGLPEGTKYVSVDNLTDSQYQHLKPLLWVEVTAIFDQHKISVLKRKPSVKSKRGNVFGVNLSTLIMRDMPTPTDNSMVPQIFRCIAYHLNSRCTVEAGILRLAGQQQKLNYICNEIEEKFYNNRRHVESLLQQATAHELTGVLKKLIRDLPDTIFTMELFDMFYKCGLILSHEDQLKALNLLVLLLPVEHRNTFRLLLQFLANVIKQEHKNRMDLHNVATITAPSFFAPRLILPKENDYKLNLKFIKSLPKEELLKHLHGAAHCVHIMEVMLKAVDTLWLIPGYLAYQARDAQRRAQDRKDKDKRTRLGKKKLQRSSTQYEPGPIVCPRIKRDLFM